MPEQAPVVDLMEALRASVAAAKGGRRLPSKAARSRKRARAWCSPRGSARRLLADDCADPAPTA